MAGSSNEECTSFVVSYALAGPGENFIWASKAADRTEGMQFMWQRKRTKIVLKSLLSL